MAPGLSHRIRFGRTFGSRIVKGCRGSESRSRTRNRGCVTPGCLQRAPAVAEEAARRSFDSETVEQALVAAPAVADPNLKVEENLGAELGLERGARGCADLLDLRSSLADQDPLLRLGLDPDLGLDRDQAVGARRDLADGDFDRVRNLLPGPVEHLLADQLGQQQLARLVAAVLRRIEERAL